MTLSDLKLSIITINYNNQSGLRKTIESVVAQTFRHFQFIVIDGGSSDGSKDVITQYADNIQDWVSEKDDGIYPAMNKGIRKARGQYLLFLNSGDVLESSDTLLRSSAFFSDGADLLYGNSRMWSEQGDYLRTPSEIMRFSDFISRRAPHHQSTFIRASLFEEIGLYSEKYKILSDWDFFMKVIFVYNKRIKYLPLTIARFNLEGMSSDEKNKGQLHSEKAAIIRENLPRFADDYHLFERYRNLIENSRIVKTYLKYFRKSKGSV